MTTWRLFTLTELTTVFSRQIRKAENLRTVGNSSFLQVCKQRAVHSSPRGVLCQQNTQDHQQSTKNRHTEEGHKSVSANEDNLASRYLPVPRDPDTAPKTLPRGQTVSLGMVLGLYSH